MNKEYILYCDESEKTGRYYSNFYGGVMVGSSQHDRIVALLKSEKQKLNLLGEIKWAKVTETYLNKYVSLIKSFFSEIRKGHIKVRIMFRHNAYEPDNLTEEDQKNTYFKLYYQFVKHAYGLENAYLNHQAKLRLYFDAFPENREAASQFKGHLLALNQNKRIKKSGIYLLPEDITEIDSRQHVLLQCLDVVLGSMHFYLNDKQNEIQASTNDKGKRTIAKKNLYEVILNEIKTLDGIAKNFRVEKSTKFESRWLEPYLHWSFVPKSHRLNKEFATMGKKQPQPAYTNSDA